MAKFDFDMTDYMAKLSTLGTKSKAVCRYALWEGAKVVADDIKAFLNAHKVSGDLAESFYITPMQDKNGYIYVEFGFAGYDRNGVPNEQKAHILESGSSKGHQKYGFMRKAIKNNKEKCNSAISRALDEKIDEIMKGN